MHRFHVVGLPHTQTTLAFSSCAYTEKVRKFCRMMRERGHEVFLYSGAQNEAPCTKHIPCINEETRMQALGDAHYTQGSFDKTQTHWVHFNANVIAAMALLLKPRDFICLIGGEAHQPIAEAFKNHMSVEFGVGYAGTFTKYRVFESYAWMHACHGARHGIPGIMNASLDWWDAVIPGYLEIERFPHVKNPAKDFVLYIGRMTQLKGIGIAVSACNRARVRLVLAGPGMPPIELATENVNVDFVGEVAPAARAELMGNAIAVMAPTLYAEPFGNVVVESMACGTPVITTDWGAFTETVINGVTGFRCRMLHEFVDAIELAHNLNRAPIRRYAKNQFSLEAVAPQYEMYFDRLYTMWDKGWTQE